MNLETKHKIYWWVGVLGGLLILLLWNYIVLTGKV